MRQLVMGSVLGVGLLGMVPAAGATGAAAPGRTSGMVRVFVTPAPNGIGGTILLTGVIGDHGGVTTVDRAGHPNPNGSFVRVRLAQGGFLVDKANLDEALTKAAPVVNQATCSAAVSGRGTVTLSQGTGTYQGISGTVTMTATFAALLPRYASGSHAGSCNESESAAPVAQWQSVTGSGIVHFG